MERPRRLQELRRSGAFNLMATGTVCGALDDLLGVAGWPPPPAWGLPLVTFAVAGAPWTVPSVGWHVDSHGPEHELPGVTVFVFLVPVTERGGGTVVPAVLDGVGVKVQELTGRAGDVVLMHPRTLHAAAPNSLAAPRMMLVEIVGRRANPGDHH